MAVNKTIETIEHIEYICDFCNKEVDKESLRFGIKLPVNFLTEQTEGMPVTPYIQYITKDLCVECFDKAVSIQGHGAQNVNTYEFVEDVKQAELKRKELLSIMDE